MQAEADQSGLLRQRPAEVRVAQADEHVHTRRAEAHTLEGDVAHRAVIVRHIEQRLQDVGGRQARQQRAGQAVDGGVDRAAQQRVDAGGHVGGEGLPERQLEVALEVDEVTQVDAQVGQLDRTEYAGDADADIDVLQELDAVDQPIGRRQRQVRNQVGQARQADAGQQHRRIEVGQHRQDETRQADARQIEVEAEVDLRQLEVEVEIGVDVEQAEQA